jgi:hypothetical protein
MQIAFIFGTVVAGLVGVLLAIFLAPFLVASPRKTRRRRRKTPKTTSNTAPLKPVRDPSSISAPTDTATIYYSPFETETTTESTRTRRNFGERPFTRVAGTATQSGSTLATEETETATQNAKYVPPALRRLQARKEKEQTVKVYLEERAAKASAASAAPAEPVVEKPEISVESALESSEVATTRWGKEGWVWQRGGKPVEVSRPAAINSRWQRSPRTSVSEPAAPESPVIESDAAPEPVAIRLDPRLLDAFAQFKRDEDKITTKEVEAPKGLVIDPRLLKAFENFQSTMESPSVLNKDLNPSASEFKPRSFQLDPAAPAFDPSFAS